MQCTNRIGTSFLGAAALCGVTLLTQASGAAESGTVAGAWQHHKVTFSYSGLTSQYSCGGLESQVRGILLHFGARPDLKVKITGACERRPYALSHTAWVDADFYSLAPAADSGAAGTVQARWAGLNMAPKRPSFMGGGDCELVDDMKDIVLNNFSLRDAQYRTSCNPREWTLGGYDVKAEALKAAASS
jgi:hypothetical protein